MPSEPSMTVEQAAASVGYRPNNLPLVMSDDLRMALRRWFCAKGLPSEFVRDMTKQGLRDGYNS